jgi:hypothetical protein
VTLTQEDVQRAHAFVELSERILLAPPDEDSETLRELRQMLPGELEDEARELQEREYEHSYWATAHGVVDSGTTQHRRKYRLKLVRHVMGDEWFDKVLAPIHAAWAETFRDLEHRLSQPRKCNRRCEKLLKYLTQEFCDECWEQDR